MFVLSKIVQFLLSPAHVLLACLVLGVVLMAWRRTRRAGTIAVVGATVVLVVIMVVPVGAWLLAALEGRFPPPDPMPAEVAGIIVLGGGQDARITVERGQPTVNDSAERMIEAAALMRRYPQAEVIFSGGLGFAGTTEADVASGIFTLMGVDTGRILFDETARNTYENALATYRLVQPDPDSTWLLVTSATHMPRSMAVFRKAGWPVVAYPVDYRTGRSRGKEAWFLLARHLGDLDVVVHEYVGLVAYWALGRSDDPWPEP